MNTYKFNFKKISAISVVVLALVVGFLVGCQKKSINDVTDLEAKMLSIESALKNGNFEIKDISLSEKNKLFFDELLQIENRRQSLKSNERVVEYESNPITKKAIEEYPFKKGDSFSENETIIFKSYFNALKNLSVSSVIVTQYYLDQIKELDIDEWTKHRCTATLSMIKDGLIYIEGINTPRLKAAPSESNFSTCWDTCIRGKLSTVFNGNWIDISWFIINWPAEFAIMSASCSWDCAF
ncbi:MAG: hypothetical protein LBU62_01905 [Bacteroidales bacterium]|jgi:hypothetical protein|nr:hypothetical protein [Bacteroidales bacterium]